MKWDTTICFVVNYLIILKSYYSLNGLVATSIKHDPHLSGQVCLFLLRFYGPVNPMGSCRVRSVYLTTRLLGRLSPLSG